MSKIRVEYEDEHIMLINKPAGLLSQADASGAPSITDYAKAYLKSDYIGLIHRLDRPVSGLMMLAKTKRAAALLSRLLQKGKIRKKYSAIVFGKPESESGELVDYILEDKKHNSKIKSQSEGRAKKACLSYETLGSRVKHDIKEFSNCFSLLSIKLITGRKHQIRLQFSNIGNPIVGDSRYFNQSDELKRRMLACSFLPRGEIALCASYIGFPHPLNNGKILETSCDLPAHWVKIL